MIELLIGVALLMILAIIAAILYVISAVEQLATIVLRHSERLDALEKPGWHLAKGYSEPQLATWTPELSGYEVEELVFEEPDDA